METEVEERLGQEWGLSPPSRRALPSFEALRAFDAVARLGGIRKAARHLGRDHAVISRHLSTIESWLGVRLVERAGRGIALTQDGQRYHKEISGAIDTIANASIDVMRRVDNRQIQIWCAPGFAFFWLSKRISQFEKIYREVDIELRSTDRRPDFASHNTDIDIRFLSPYAPSLNLVTGLRSIEMARSPIIAIASPAYLEASPAITTPDDLVKHRLLHEDSFDGWNNWLAAYDVFGDVELSGPRLWHGHMTLDAAIEGRGIALSNALIAKSQLETGHIVEVGVGNPSFRHKVIGIYHMISRSDRWDAPLIRKFRNWLLQEMKVQK